MCTFNSILFNYLLFYSLHILRELFLGNDQDYEQFIERLATYINGGGDSLFIQAYKQSREDEESLKLYEEDEDQDQDQPPEKVKGIPALFVIEKMMHQVGMLDHRSIPSKDSDVDKYAKRYTIQDLILVITLMGVSLVREKSLLLPACPKQSKAVEGDLKSKRDALNKSRMDVANTHRTKAKDKLATVDFIKSLSDDIEDRLLNDYTQFYTAMNKNALKDNGKMMSVFTNSRVLAFETWSRNGGNKKESKKRVRTDNELDEKEKRRLRCEALQKGTVDLTGDDEEAIDEDWL